MDIMDEGAIPSTSTNRGKPDACLYDIESYLYVDGKLVRIKTLSAPGATVS